ncbi:hypothetical protein [Geobacillus stearothermophilus]|uniref:hypothetical protein n=1 Tax=Geobacillus stearothermophilus TaxID=1422 RepID=UPI0024027D5A|nr:hypothetical protein [Geobacillus stearothermophilus]MDF9296090.1 hypothetical protein [Geobacillus stearothermophilus]
MKLNKTKEELLNNLKRNADILRAANGETEWYIDAEIAAMENVELEALTDGYEYSTRLLLDQNAVEVIKRKPVWNGEYWDFENEQTVVTVAMQA